MGPKTHFKGLYTVFKLISQEDTLLEGIRLSEVFEMGGEKGINHYQQTNALTRIAAMINVSFIKRLWSKRVQH